MPNLKKVLVTGGAGLIGSHLVDLLIERGYAVTILDNLESQTHPHGPPDWLHPQAHFVKGDIRNASDWREALEGVQFVFHQAAFGGFTGEISKYLEVNAMGTARLFEALASGRFRVEKIVVASSQALYGEGLYQCEKEGPVFPLHRSLAKLEKKDWELSCPQCGGNLQSSPTPEDSPWQGQTPYALSKEFEERLTLAQGKKLGIPVVALRYGVTYGPRQSLFNPYTGVVSIFSTRILSGLSPLIYEEGRQTRDFIYVGDVARANLFLMENEKANFQVFNVGTGKATSILELARLLNTRLGKSIAPEIPGEFRVGDVRHLVLDPEKLNRLGFQATTALEEGLAHFAEWILSQEEVEERFSEAYGILKKHGIVRR